MTEITPQLVERMVALVRDLNAEYAEYGTIAYISARDRVTSIVAELPEPVDPDRAEVLALAPSSVAAWLTPTCERHWEPYGSACGFALAALKRGRQLEREGK